MREKKLTIKTGRDLDSHKRKLRQEKKTIMKVHPTYAYGTIDRIKKTQKEHKPETTFSSDRKLSNIQMQKGSSTSNTKDSAVFHVETTIQLISIKKEQC